MTDGIRLETRDWLATIVLDRPDKRNAFNAAMWRGLEDLCVALAADPAVRVVVVRSSSAAAFCAGADIGEFDAFRHDPAKTRANADLIRSATRALQTLPRPTIARIDGDCFGGGTIVALSCDFRMAAAPARFAITPARLGLSYAIADINVLVRTVGLSAARRLLMAGETFDAAQARQCGMVDYLFDDAVAMDEALAALAARMSTLSRYSLRSIKANLSRVVDGATDDDDASRQRFTDAFHGVDLEEGMAAFLEKRRPVFPYS